MSGPRPAAAAAVADDAGRFRFELVPAGRWRVVARSPVGHGETEVEGSSGDEVEAEVVVGGVAVEGRVWIGDEPATGGRVILARPAAGSAGGAPAMLLGPEARSGFSDGGGVVVWEGVPPGTYRACARPFGGALGCTEPFRLEEDGEAELVLATGRGGAVRVEGTAPGGVGVALPDGTSLTALAILAGTVRAEGADVVVGPLEPGTYLVTVPGRVGPRVVEVREGSTATLGD